MPPWGLFWLAAGGLAYTGGVVFFAWDRVRFGHLVWHLCVIVGTACHYIAVLRYAV
jgi:hemolysin III